jgi:beta-galactosidase
MPGRRISRRKFIGTSIAGAATAVAMPSGNGADRPTKAGPDSDSSLSDLRLRVPCNKGWRFKRQASPGSATEPELVGAERPNFDDSTWNQVWLPHTWDATADNPFAVTGHFRGVGWYRKALEVPQAWRNRRLLMHFNGAFQITDAWVNGRRVGQHVGGYTSFAFDVTDALEFGKTNLVAIKVDDVLSPFIAPAEERNVANYGGIYRSVWLEVMNPTHVRYNGTWLTIEGDEERPVVAFALG